MAARIVLTVVVFTVLGIGVGLTVATVAPTFGAGLALIAAVSLAIGVGCYVAAVRAHRNGGA